ncbi:MAG: hypothetical protein U0R49_01265 [Fimbriimonadales bacterium]
MKTRAFGLVEVLVIVGILAITAAIVTPVYLRAKDRAKENICISNLKQLHVATMMYRHDYDGDGKYGKPSHMGLPLYTTLTLRVNKYITEDVQKCLGVSPTPPSPVLYGPCFYGEVPGEHTGPGPTPWERTVLANRDDTVLYCDLNHQPPGSKFQAERQTHRGLGVYLSGESKTVKRPGNPLSINWWHSK